MVYSSDYGSGHNFDDNDKVWCEAEQAESFRPIGIAPDRFQSSSTRQFIYRLPTSPHWECTATNALRPLNKSVQKPQDRLSL